MKKKSTYLCISSLVLLLITTSCTGGFLNPPATLPVINQDSDSGSILGKPETGAKPPQAHLILQTLNNTEGRTVLPQKLDPANLKDYLLTASKDGGVPIFIGTWATYAAMIAATDTLIEIGFWDFFLEAQNGGQVALEGVLNNKTIVEGINTLDFDLQEAATGTGSLAVSLYYPSSSGVQAIKAGLFNLDNTPTAGYSLETLNEFAGSGSYAGKNGITYAKPAVNRGFYILKIYLYRDTAATDQMNVYSELVRIAPGCESTQERTINDLNTLFSISYNWDSGVPTSGATVPLSFNVDKPVTLPSAIEVKKEGYTFGGWYEDAGFTGTAITGWSAGDRTGDVTLYAKWSKNLTFNISYGTETPAPIDLVSNGSYTFTAIEKDAIQTLDLTAVFDRGTPVVTRLNSLYTQTPESIGITTGIPVPITLGYGKNTITLEFEGITYTIICYAALLPVEGTGSSLPVSVFNETNTQAAVTRIATFAASTDYTTMSAAQKTTFSPSVIAVAGTDTTSAANTNSMIEITDATIPITLRGYGTGANAGIIDNNNTANRRALQISTGASVTIEANLTLTGGNQTNGGGVYATGTNTQFTINGGSIINNIAYNGGGVYVDKTAQLTLGGAAVISDNETGGDGGGVYVTDMGTRFTMNGGIISGNSTEEGGGVYVAGEAQFTMNGTADISNNTATSNGGGVYVASEAQFILSGTADIRNNTATSASVRTRGGGVYVTDMGTRFTMTGGIISGNSTEEGGGVYLTGAAHFTMNGTAKIKGNTATSNGGGVSLIGASTTFTMSDEASIETNTATSGSGGGVYAASGAHFTMNGTSKIKGDLAASASVRGGGVYVTDIGTQFTMNGGIISGNSTEKGGGVYVASEAQFILSGTAVVSGNFAEADGGGVHVDSAAQFILSGTAVVSGNTAAYNGGGVSLTTIGTTFTMRDNASIKSNKTINGCGGGVYAAAGVQLLTQSDAAVISDNTAALDGGGVYLIGAAQFILNGTATISDNIVISGIGRGGGVYAASGVQFTLSGSAVVSGNTTKKNGGGVFATGTNTHVSMNGRTSIKTNTATSATGCGGGVYIDQGAQLTLNETADISSNTAALYGGGVYLIGAAQFTLSGSVKVQGNKKVDSALIETNNNIQMEDETNFLKITGALTGGANAIGVTRVTSGVVAQGDGYSLIVTDQKALVPDGGGSFNLSLDNTQLKKL